MSDKNNTNNATVKGGKKMKKPSIKLTKKEERVRQR